MLCVVNVKVFPNIEEIFIEVETMPDWVKRLNDKIEPNMSFELLKSRL